MADSTSLAPSPTPIDVFRAAQRQAQARGSGAALEPRGPALPTPSVPQTIAKTNAEAAVWGTAVATMMTAVAGIAAVKLVAEKNPAYARIIQAATQTTAEAAQLVVTIAADGAAIEAAFASSGAVPPT